MQKGPGPDAILDRITEETCPGGLLIVTSTYDLGPPELMASYFTKPKCRVKWVNFSLSSHFAMFEETEGLMRVIATFLTTV